MYIYDASFKSCLMRLLMKLCLSQAKKTVTIRSYVVWYYIPVRSTSYYTTAVCMLKNISLRTDLFLLCFWPNSSISCLWHRTRFYCFNLVVRRSDNWKPCSIRRMVPMVLSLHFDFSPQRPISHIPHLLSFFFFFFFNPPADGYK